MNIKLLLLLISIPILGFSCPPSVPAPSEPAPVEQSAEAHWEFLNPDDDWKPVNELVSNTSPYLIIASNGDPDIREKLPIKIELKVDGVVVLETTITGDPTKVCRDATGCSVQGPLIDPAWEGKKIELIAYDNDDNVLAVHTQ